MDMEYQTQEDNQRASLLSHGSDVALLYSLPLKIRTDRHGERLDSMMPNVDADDLNSAPTAEPAGIHQRNTTRVFRTALVIVGIQLLVIMHPSTQIMLRPIEP
jgi:hypothetical protein